MNALNRVAREVSSLALYTWGYVRHLMDSRTDTAACPRPAPAEERRSSRTNVQLCHLQASEIAAPKTTSLAFPRAASGEDGQLCEANVIARNEDLKQIFRRVGTIG